MSNEHEKNNVEVEDKAIDQIARFFVFVARDMEREERQTGILALPKSLIKQMKNHAE